MASTSKGNAQDFAKDNGKEKGRDKRKDTGTENGKDIGKNKGQDIGKDSGKNSGKDSGKGKVKEIAKGKGQDIGEGKGKDIGKGKGKGKDIGKGKSQGSGNDKSQDNVEDNQPSKTTEFIVIESRLRPTSRLSIPTLEFCPECNNMLYPKFNKAEKVLVEFCRSCMYQGKISRDRYCTYATTITHEINELSLIPPEIIEDPTMARTRSHPCPKCKGKIAVFMQGLLEESQEAMILYYICCNSKCRFKWSEL